MPALYSQHYYKSKSWTAFTIPYPRRQREIQFVSPQFSLENMTAYIGDCHLQLKEQRWLAERVFQNGNLHRGMPFAIKRTILIGWTIGRFRGAFCLLSEVGDTLDVSPRQTLNVNWAKTVKELTQSRLWDIPWTRPWPNQWPNHLYMSLPSQALGLIMTGQELVGSVSGLSGISGQGSGSLLSQWGSTIKLPWVRIVTSRYPSWYDLRSC